MTKKMTRPVVAGYHHGHLKETLLVVAERLLERDGVAGLSLRAVAREACVSHAAPYRHFRDKADLMGELVGVGFRRLTDALNRASADHPQGPALALQAGGRAYVRLAVASPALTTLMFGGMDQETMTEAQRACGDCAFAALLRIVQSGIDGGVYRTKDTLAVAVTAWSAMHGLATLFVSQSLARASQTSLSPDDLATAVSELVLHGLLR